MILYEYYLSWRSFSSIIDFKIEIQQDWLPREIFTNAIQNKDNRRHSSVLNYNICNNICDKSQATTVLSQPVAIATRKLHVNLVCTNVWQLDKKMGLENVAFFF